MGKTEIWKFVTHVRFIWMVSSEKTVRRNWKFRVFMSLESMFCKILNLFAGPYVANCAARFVILILCPAQHHVRAPEWLRYWKVLYYGMKRVIWNTIAPNSDKHHELWRSSLTYGIVTNSTLTTLFNVLMLCKY